MSKAKTSLYRTRRPEQIWDRLIWPGQPLFEWTNLSCYLCRKSLDLTKMSRCWPFHRANMGWTLTVAPLSCCSHVPEPRSQLVSSRGAKQRWGVTPNPRETVLWLYYVLVRGLWLSKASLFLRQVWFHVHCMILIAGLNYSSVWSELSGRM